MWRAEPAHGGTQRLYPHPQLLYRCFCRAGCPKIPACSENVPFSDFSDADIFPLILLFLLQALNCLWSSLSKEMFVSYWTRNRKSSQGHLTCSVFVSKYQCP